MQPGEHLTKISEVPESNVWITKRRLTRILGFGSVALLFGIGSIGRSRRGRLFWTSTCSRWMCKVLGIRIVRDGHPMDRGILLSNHLSYVDALVLASMAPCSFVTSREVEASALGLLCRWAGCLFVERRAPARVRSDRAAVARFAQTERVVLFAEGTSTRGKTILPFKRGLFGNLPKGTPVQPVVIVTSCNNVPYVDDDHFGSHFWKLIGVPSVEVSITCLEAREVVPSEMLKSWLDEVRSEMLLEM